MKPYALVQTAVAPLWSAPREGAERLDEALCGTVVQILESNGAYRRVRTDYHYEGWVQEGCLFPIVSPEEWIAAPKSLISAPFADVQKEPSVRASTLCTLTRGALVRRKGTNTGPWCGVLLPDGVSGFLPAASLAEPTQNANPQLNMHFRQNLTRAAQSYLGTPYRWGGKTPMGIDCSGLCFMAYALNGVTIFRDSHMEPGFPIRKIPLCRAAPGDLLYFPGHMAMLIGNGRYVHATAGNGCHSVVVNSLRPNAPDYRADLPPKLLAVGSLWGCK